LYITIIVVFLTAFSTCVSLLSSSLHRIFRLCLLFLLLHSLLREITLLCLKCAGKLFIKFLLFMHYSRALYSKIQLTESVLGKRNQCLVHAVLDYPVFQHTLTCYVVDSSHDVTLSAVII